MSTNDKSDWLSPGSVCSSDNGGSNFLEKALCQWASLTKAFPFTLRLFPRPMKVVIAATVFFFSCGPTNG